MTAETNYTLSLPERLPTLWISHLAIFRSMKHSKPIRSIDLRPGLNIIWGVDRAPGKSPGRRRGSGQNVGKTLFTRLLRYCLGESTIASKDVTGKIRSMYPAGCVGIIAHVNGEQWAVIRPFNEKTAPFVGRDLTLSEVLHTDNKSKLSYKYFMEAVQEATTRKMGGEGEAVEWKHLLAWCARDHEARYRKISEWRVPDSQARMAVTPESAIKLMRLAFGLSHEHQTAMAEQIEKLQAEADNARKAAQERLTMLQQREGDEFRRLANMLGPVGYELDKTSNLFSIAYAVDCVRDGLQEERTRIQNKLAELDEQAWDLNARLHAMRANERTIRAYLEVPGKAEKAMAVSEADVNDQGWCDEAQRHRSNCDHINELKEQIRQEREAAKGAEPIDGPRHREFGEKLRILEAELAELERQKNVYLTERSELVRQSAVRDRRIEDLQAQFEVWTRERKAAGDYDGDQVVQKLASEAAQKETEIIKLKDQLSQLTEEQNRRVEALRELFNYVVNRAISESARGIVDYQKGEYSIFIKQGEELGGETYRTTLRVLLFDLSSMIAGCIGLAHHPGLLIHDSPREAEMAQSLFDGILELAADLSAAHGQIPFQYIVTTTSTPPKPLRSRFVKLRLDGVEDKRMLFKERLRYVEPDEQVPIEELDLGLDFSPAGGATDEGM